MLELLAGISIGLWIPLAAWQWLLVKEKLVDAPRILTAADDRKVEKLEAKIARLEEDNSLLVDELRKHMFDTEPVIVRAADEDAKGTGITE